MLEDRYLVWKMNHGSIEALSRIYQKNKVDLLRLATALSNNVADAEDVVQDVFLEFAKSAGQFRLTGSLRSYLATCVANRARNILSAKRRQNRTGLDDTEVIALDSKSPYQWVIRNEELVRLNSAIKQLPYEQREAITLHLQGGAKFKEIAKLQNVSLKTVFSRYRYGLDKLRSVLNSEVAK